MMHYPVICREGYDGGIWQVDENIFDETQDTAAHPELTETYTAISNSLDIDWPTATWGDLRKPLFSALAARLFFSIVAEDIPMAGNLQGQAEHWKEYFNSDPGDTVQEFIDSVNELESLGKILKTRHIQLSQLFFAYCE